MSATATAGAAGLSGRVAVELEGFRLDVSLAVQPGTATAVLGPNGAGKTTLLRAVAGLEPLGAGSLSLAGRTLDDGGATFMVPEARQVALVPQDHLLFAHMSVLDNVAFGLRCGGVGRRAARERAAEVLDRVGLGGFGDRRPGGLSGGQSQRVALARALAAEPGVLLLDEPLAALDARLRPAMRAELRHWLADFEGAALMVTHDPLDAYALADDLVVLEAGCVTQSGSLRDVTARPRSRYVADLVGTNLLVGSGGGHVVSVGAARVAVAESVSGEVFATVAPSAVAVALRSPGREPPAGSARNHWAMTVTSTEPMGERVRVALSGDLDLTAELTAESVAELGLGNGVDVWATAKATEVFAYPR